MAAVQTTCAWDREQNVERTCTAAHEAAVRGAQVVCLQELFETPSAVLSTEKMLGLLHPRRLRNWFGGIAAAHVARGWSATTPSLLPCPSHSSLTPGSRIRGRDRIQSLGQTAGRLEEAPARAQGGVRKRWRPRALMNPPRSKAAP